MDDASSNEVFQSLSDSPACITSKQIKILEAYSLHVHDFSHDINKVRLNNFLQTAEFDIRALIPSRSGLIKRIKCASLQARWYWKLCVENVQISDPEDWRWIKTGNTMYIPMWHGHDQSIDLNMVISTCTCE